MRKSRSQPSLAPLNSAEKEQLAHWLRHETYDVVLERVRKPRPDGFGLKISRQPLQTFYAKVQKLDRINSRLPDSKKLTIAQYESLDSGDILLLTLPENDKCKMLDAQCSMKESREIALATDDDIHHAILQTVHDLVLAGEDNPTRLLALQRLADFRARAEFRAHKVQMDLHRKHIADERLALTKRNTELREKQFAANKSPDAHPQAGLSRPWTPEELAQNQPLVEARIQADPLLRQIGVPPVDWPPKDRSPQDPREAPDFNAK
jgi:hypothetical protein